MRQMTQYQHYKQIANLLLTITDSLGVITNLISCVIIFLVMRLLKKFADSVKVGKKAVKAAKRLDYI